MIFQAILLASSSLLPSAPAPIAVQQPKPAVKHFNAYDYAIYGGVVGYRLGDYFTTEHALARGAVEVELPNALVRNKPGFMAYSLGMAAGEIAASAYFHKHGHPRLARIADTLSVAAGSATDFHNMTCNSR